MQKSLVKNSIYNIIYTTINVFFPLVTSIYSARILLATGIGKVTYAQNIASYFVTFAALGLPSYGVREFAKVRDDAVSRNRLFTELFFLNFLSTTLAVALYGLFMSQYIPQMDKQLYIAAGAVIFFNYLNIDWLYCGIEEYGYITSRNLVVKIFSFLSLVLFVKDQKDYILYAWINSIATGVNYLFNVLYSRKFVSFHFLGLNLIKHVRPLLAIAVILFLGSIYSKVDVTMIGILSSVESVGYYGHSLKIITMVLTVSHAITGTFLPRLSYYYDNDRPAFYNLVKKGFDILCFITFPLVAGLFLIAEQMVVLLYGTEFAPAVLTTRLLCPIIFIKGFGDLLCYQLAYSTKNEKIIIPASGFAAVSNVLTNAVLIPVFRQNGAVVASLISELVTNSIQFVYIKKRVCFHLNCRSILVAVIATSVMAVAVFMMMHLQLPVILSIIFEVVCGAIVYIAVNILLGNPIMIDSIQWIRRKIKRYIA